jgi:uncharacterized membrane protein
MWKTNQPKIELKKSTFETNLDIISGFLILLQFVIIFIFWSKLPDKIPIHFNLSGEPNGWGGKNSIFILPVLSIVLFSLITILSSYPHTFNYLFEITEKNSVIQYTLVKNYLAVIKTLIIVLFMLIILMITEASKNGFINTLVYLLYIPLVLIFIATAHYIIKSFKAK